jgi:hypothetical protein
MKHVKDGEVIPSADIKLHDHWKYLWRCWTKKESINIVDMIDGFFMVYLSYLYMKQLIHDFGHYVIFNIEKNKKR